MDHADAVAFAADWVQAWNSRDLEKVLSHFADDVVFTSPVAAQFLEINYRNQLGRLVNEILIFDGSLVRQGHGTYLGNDANPAGVTSG